MQPEVDTFEGRIFRWCRGNEDAVNFCALLYDACQVWDDIEDEGGTDRHNAAISWLAFGKEYHPFFRANADLLRPAMLLAYLQWRAANVLDHGDRLDVAKSYMLRAAYYSVIHLCAWICGGDDWAAEAGPEIYRTYGETPAQIWEEFN